MNAVPENPGPGLAVARCLREAYGDRVRIVGLGYDALDSGLYVRDYCDAAYLLPYPSAGAHQWRSRVEAICGAEPFDVLIPCLDAELPTVVRMQRDLSALGIRTFIPDADQLSRRAKDRLPELATLADMACPEVRAISDTRFFQSCERDGWRYPLVVKGVYYDARIVRNSDEAAQTFRSIAAEWGLPVLVQRFVAGEEYNLAAIGDGRGAMLSEVMMKKRAVTGRGKAWAGIATSDTVLASAARRLVAELKWKGPLEVEVMRDAQGAYHLIEINPRFPSWIYLSHGVGRNLPALLLELALGREPPEPAPPRPGTMFIRHVVDTIVPLADFEALFVSGGFDHQ